MLNKDKMFFQAGAGIVKDSNPLREYAETVSKLSALISITIEKKGFSS
jgi:anthranilate/para-aminobenzoate synthase component I